MHSPTAASGDPPVSEQPRSIDLVAPALSHRLLAVRTVAVSFGAAVRTARRDRGTGAAERDALIETWRAWTRRALDRYAREIEELYGEPREESAEPRRLLADELERAYRTVNEA